MNFKECKQLISDDLHKVASHNVDKNILYFFLRYLITNTSFKYSFWWRIGSFLKQSTSLLSFFYPIVYLFYKHYSYKYSCQIPLDTRIFLGAILPTLWSSGY